MEPGSSDNVIVETTYRFGFRCWQELLLCRKPPRYGMNENSPNVRGAIVLVTHGVASSRRRRQRGQELLEFGLLLSVLIP